VRDHCRGVNLSATPTISYESDSDIDVWYAQIDFMESKEDSSDLNTRDIHGIKYFYCDSIWHKDSIMYALELVQFIGNGGSTIS